MNITIGKATFHSLVPFHYVTVHILDGNRRTLKQFNTEESVPLSELEHHEGEKQYSLLAIKVIKDQEFTVSVIRGEISDLTKKKDIYMISRSM